MCEVHAVECLCGATLTPPIEVQEVERGTTYIGQTIFTEAVFDDRYTWVLAGTELVLTANGEQILHADLALIMAEMLTRAERERDWNEMKRRAQDDQFAEVRKIYNKERP